MPLKAVQRLVGLMRVAKRKEGHRYTHTHTDKREREREREGEREREREGVRRGERQIVEHVSTQRIDLAVID